MTVGFGSSEPASLTDPGGCVWLTYEPPNRIGCADETEDGCAAYDTCDRPPDDWIDSTASRDAVFANLRLWLDANHNGISEGGELHQLPSLDVRRLELDYSTFNRVDEHGNRFRYRARVRRERGSDVGRWAWDVFLVPGGQADKGAVITRISEVAFLKKSIFSLRR